jgi:hypothetical protein
MKTKQLFVGLIVGLIIGFFATYIYFVSTNANAAGQKILGWVGGIAGIVGATAYFCQKYIEHRLGVESERLKIRFTKTYSLRADAIAEAHGKLLDLYEAVDEFQFNGGREVGSEKWVAASNRINEARNNLIDFLARKQLYLPKPTTKKIRELLGKVYGSHLRYGMLKEYSKEERSAEVKKWLDEKEQLPVYLAQLEEDFRDALGFVD